MEVCRVTSWAELNEVLFEGSWKGDIERFRSDFVFRGLSKSAYDLKTSLIRLGGEYVQLEKHLIRNFKKYGHKNVEQNQSIWDWLSMAQHHGLPTRLLDWTYSPYVALHFATANIHEYDDEGVIWCADYVKIHELLPNKLLKVLQVEGCNAFTTQMLSQATDSLEKFDSLSREDFVAFFEPPSMDDRIINQFALFSVASNSRTILDQWLINHPETCKKIVIPQELKWEVRDKLDQANITERVLFPGLSGLCGWLTRHYSPKNMMDGSGVLR